MTLLDIPFKVAKPHLDANPRAVLKEALKDIGRRRTPHLAKLRRLPPATND